MKLVEGVAIILKDPAFPQSIEVFLKQEGESLSLTEAMLVRWPIDIHIDDKGAYVTLRIPVKHLEINGIAYVEDVPE